MIYESPRDRMIRWVQAGTNGARLVALGVPSNLMTDEQRRQASQAYLIGARINPISLRVE